MLSAKPLEQAYESTEPKGSKRAKLLEHISRAEQKYHRNLQALISDSLGEIKSVSGGRQWHLPRQVQPSVPEASFQPSPDIKAEETCLEPPVILSCLSNFFQSVRDIADRVVSNPSSLCTSLAVGSHAYHIPPRSTFILADMIPSCPPSRASSTHLLHGSFDFILVDPPWQNRSVRHAKAYKTPESRSQNPFLSVLPILKNNLNADGLVGIWVTNKAAIRRLVLSSLHQIGYRLHEEWVWMKTTINGDPVTELAGIWRRPYEVLLLFRKGHNHVRHTGDPSEHSDSSTWATGVPYRIFVAVPSHHSQKPCLKEFIEPLMVNPTSYQALEMFARNLTAGWFSCGNEVLKFNLEGHWANY